MSDTLSRKKNVLRKRDFARAGAGGGKLTRRAKLCRTHLAALCCTDPHRKFQGKFTSRCRIATNPSQDLLGRLVSVEEDSTPANTADAPQVDTEYAYDLSGRMASETTTAYSLKTTAYSYDSLGRLDTQTDTDQSGNTLAEYDYTVRPDGKRTELAEEFWFDDDGDGVVESTDGDGNVDPGETKATTYDWTYDAAGRLTDEVLDHWDNDDFDRTETFVYDLTGNRHSRTVDHVDASVNDEVFTYDYDANDRLTDEYLDNDGTTGTDQTTTYAYDHTQQTSKTVTDTSSSNTISKQIFGYNLQGRMSSVINEGYDGSGVLNSQTRTSYEYDSKSYRIKLVNETAPNLDGNYSQLDSTVEFLADHHNHTGYAQTIRETKVENGHTLITDYTFGHDEIAQRRHGNDGTGAAVDETHVFGHDGHGSVRVLYDLGGTVAEIAQAFTFAAYGEMLAVHNHLAASVAITSRLTSLGYSGEHFDAQAQQQYLRARWYNPANGRFNRLDPFAGNMQDPQSLHKYAYVHGDPINLIDPAGLMSLRTKIAAIGVGALIIGGLVFLASSSSDSDPGVDTLTIKFAWQYDYHGYFDLMVPAERDRMKREEFQRHSDAAKATARRSVQKLNEYLQISCARWGLNCASNVVFDIQSEPTSIRGMGSPMAEAYDIDRNTNHEFGVMILTNWIDRANRFGRVDGAAREGTTHFFMWAQDMSEAGEPYAFTTLAHELGHLGRYSAAEGEQHPDEPDHHKNPNMLMGSGSRGYMIDKAWAQAMQTLLYAYGK